MARHRSRWRVWQRYMDGERFVFIDETAAPTAMTRLYGWSPRGERLVDAVPAGHWKTTTVVAGLRASGIIAPFVLDGPMTGAVFRAYVEQVLAPALEPGDVVAMDNLATRSPGSKRRSGRQGPACFTSRPIPLISTRLSNSLPSSRLCSGRRLQELRLLSGRQSAPCSTTLPRPNARTTSSIQDMSSSKSEML